jgi:hypothetical protein
MTKAHMAKGEKKKICGSLYRFSKTNFEAKCSKFTKSIDTPRHIVVPVPNNDLDSQRHLLWSVFMFNELMWEVIVRFDDIW